MSSHTYDIQAIEDFMAWATIGIATVGVNGQIIMRPLGRPNSNAVKFFSAVESIALLADREWLDDATKTIGQFWKRKNARRNGVIVEKREVA